MKHYGSGFIKTVLLLAIVLTVGIVWKASSGDAADKNIACKDNAVALLEKEKSKYEFTRCTQEVFNAESGQSLTRVRVVSGDVSEQWEHECGYNAACKIYIGWFDKDNNIVSFVDPPDVANHDPSVYTLGCGDINSSSGFDTKVDPALVFENNQYWWKVNYKNITINDADNSEVGNEKPLCELSGTSMIGKKEILSSVKVEYLSSASLCESEKTSTCRTVDSLKNKSAESCGELGSDNETQYDYQCVRNYIAQTGDMKLCGSTVKYEAKVDCKRIPLIKEL